MRKDIYVDTKLFEPCQGETNWTESRHRLRGGFAPTAKSTWIQIIFGQAADNNLSLHQVNIETVLLKGVEDKDTGMVQTKKCVDESQSTLCAD